MTAHETELGREFRDIRCIHSEGLPGLLTQLRLSVLISTYQTGHLVVVAARQGKLALSFHQFPRAMGVAAKPGTISVCTRKEVWFLRDAPDIAAKLFPVGNYDACFLARTSHFTGDIEAHESAWVGHEFWIVNTLFSCLAALHPHYSFAPRWRPSFVSALRPSHSQWVCLRRSFQGPADAGRCAHRDPPRRAAVRAVGRRSADGGHRGPTGVLHGRGRGF